jgi:FKBP-type peptidyl-prolyl cis-trans isomerase 2
VFLWFIFLLTGCASQGTVKPVQLDDVAETGKAMIVQPGDNVDILFLCRFKNGEVVADSNAVADIDLASNDFVKKGEENGTILIVAVRPDEPLSERKYRPAPFDQELLERLSRKVTGMREAEKRQVELTAEMIQAENEQAGFAWLNKVRTRAKVKKMSTCEYQNLTGNAPEKGQSFSLEPSFTGVVEDIADGQVVIRISATPGSMIETPFGPGTIRDEGENYKVYIDAKEGSIVRTGAKIGRITHVDDEVITVDYRHPFGYEVLICDLTVEKVSRKDIAKIGSGVQ